MHSDKAYHGIRYDDPLVQQQFDQLVQRIRDAEQAREPIAARHRQAERENEDGTLGSGQFDAIDHQYIAANNSIAAAQHAVDAFLNANPNYHSNT